MIAVVILAVGLASLFTSEAGAIRIAQRARTTTIASLLARCKMAEVEEQVAKEGWPGELIEGRDECCEDGEKDGYTCEWKVERIKLPDIDEDKDKDDGDRKDGDKDGDKGGQGKPTGMIDQLAELSKQEPGDRLSGITDMLSGGRSSKDEKLASTGKDDKKTKEEREEESMLDPMSSMVMGLAFPLMKPVIEEGVRRASVAVKWKEGEKEQAFEVVQFLVSEAQIIVQEQDEDNPNAQTGTPNAATITTTTSTTATPVTTPSTSSKSK
jgi:general secretion pathway protein I